MLSLNNRCGFPSMCLMENRDLLMMINSGQVPPLHVLPQPSCLRSAVLNLCLKSTQRTHVLVVWHFLWRRKDVSFPARVRWQCQRKAHSSCSWQSTGSHSPGEVCVDQRAYRSWCQGAVQEGRHCQDTLCHASKLWPVLFVPQQVWLFYCSRVLPISTVLDGIMHLLIKK